MSLPKPIETSLQRQKENQQQEIVNNITVDELADRYLKNPDDAKQKLHECFAAAFDAFNGQKRDTGIGEYLENQRLMDDILESIVEWSPRQNLLILYLRWAKRQPKHHQTD